ncbi:sialidase family protein [Aquimarina algicola]|uniref:Oxidoreductase n=1 Tax=Aquimarina algicola TaxID=2589995 RepID=A0A504J2F7_9FLAO|nr:oxidoreductase [Aquimarina algicola]TPN85096.1 oxidoreductase [Aquimarina algicola]
MRVFTILLLFLVSLFYGSDKSTKNQDFSRVSVTIIHEDSIRVRAIDIYNDTLLGFGYDKGYGFINLNTNEKNIIGFERENILSEEENWVSEQRSVGFAGNSFFTLGVGSPARLRKVDLKTLEEKIVYTEIHEKVFYDAMLFWNEKEGIAMGDPTDGCLSIIVTRNGGETWNKIPCKYLPKTFEGEAAFAASNTNIKIIDDKTWIVSGGKKSRVFYSPDRGKTWDVYDTPIISETQTTGIYSVDFYDKNKGVVYGGDYTNPNHNKVNKAITNDGGRNWELVSDGTGPGYKSCVQYVPNTNGKSMVVVGFTGISLSNDSGTSWKKISDESFYTLRFITNNTAIAAGKGKIAKLVFN